MVSNKVSESLTVNIDGRDWSRRDFLRASAAAGIGIVGADKLLGANSNSVISASGVPVLTAVSTTNQNLGGDPFGASQYLLRSVPIKPKFPLTIACWYKCGAITANNAPVPGNYPTQGFPITGIMGFSDFYNFDGAGIGANYIDIFIWDLEWSIEVGNNNVQSHLACTAGQNGSPLLVADHWYHIAGVFGPTSSPTETQTATLYVNGVPVATNSALSWDITNFVDPVVTMGTVMGLNYFYSLNGGAIGLPAYWHAALTAGEIKRLSKGIHPATIQPAKLITLPQFADSGLIQDYPTNKDYSFNFSGSKTTDDLQVQFELGNNFTSAVNGEVTAIKFYKPATDPYTSHKVNLWLQSTGVNLATATSSSEPTSGWVTVDLTTPVEVTAGTPYVVSFNTPEGHFQYSNESASPGTYPIRNGPLTAHSGCYLEGAGYPANQGSYYYYVDLVFKTGEGAIGFPDREGHYFINVGGAT
ncbi:MAG: DUF4082 domain-containing protein [Verrucomicrobia bacterium]|nr:DUF4082 domain-containing protein [Verrucomicrobiota bacterium]